MCSTLQSASFAILSTSPSFHLESLAKSQGFALKVSDYRTTRKHNQSIYKTYVDDLTILVPKIDKISIRVPEGNYILKNLELYKENYYETLIKKQIGLSILLKKLNLMYSNYKEII